jgi:hypothetical protein
MITVAPDGTAKAVRVSVAVVDGKLWSSGTRSRARTRRLRRDPRATLFVLEPEQAYRSFETTVRLLEGQEGIDANVRLLRQFSGSPEGPVRFFGTVYEREDELRAALVADERLVYEFDVVRASGMDEVLKRD